MSLPTKTEEPHAAARTRPSPMFGAVVGDVAGSIYEHANCKSERCSIFEDGSSTTKEKKHHFTDDTVLTMATAERFLLADADDDGFDFAADDDEKNLYQQLYQTYGRRYSKAGYGGNFRKWMYSDNPKPYRSWGNGSAMRVSPVGWATDDLDACLDEAMRSAEVTHDHPEGVKGARAVAAAVFLARTGKGKQHIREYITGTFGYDLSRTVEDIRPGYKFDVSCQGSVPEAIIAFLESSDFEDAIRKAISLGGDSDTIACIAGSVAHAYYGEIPQYMIGYCRDVLDPSLLATMDKFWAKYDSP